MHRNLPPLLASRAFEAFGRCGSVRGAADELAVSHTVVSRHVQNLEATLGVRLVRKAGRGLVLTPEGVRLAEQLRRAFDTIADACADLRHGTGDAVHIRCGAGLASRRLLVCLPDLEARLGGRDVKLEPNDSRAGLSRDALDAEIIYLENPPTAGDVRAEIIAIPRIIAVASPVLKAMHPEVVHAADLIGLPLLHEQSTQQWETWLRRAGVTILPRLSGAQLWHGHMTLEAARLGQGVALVSDLIAADTLAAGDLVEVVPSNVILGGYYLVSAARKWDTPTLLIVRAWLRDIFAPHVQLTHR